MVLIPLQMYAAVKSYSLKGKLIKKKDLQTLAESRNLDELIMRIKNTTYAEAISKLTKPFTAQRIELRLRDKQSDLHHTMILASGGDNLLFAYYLKFILRNLKIILKGKILNKTQEQIENSISLHAEELIGERDIVVRAIVAKNFEEAVATLKTIGIGEEIAEACAQYNEKKQIQALELYFDKFFYQNISHALKSHNDHSLRSLCYMEIDYYNIMSILRGKFWNLDENQLQKLLVSSGTYESKELLTKMILADSPKSALAELQDTPYKKIIPLEDTNTISKFEETLERRIYENITSQFVHISSFSPVLAIVRLLDYEVRNIAAIAFAVEQRIPSQIVMERIITKD